MVGQIHNISNEIKVRINRLMSSSLFVFENHHQLEDYHAVVDAESGAAGSGAGGGGNTKSILKQPQRVIELESPLDNDSNERPTKKVRIKDHVKSCIEYFKSVERRRIEKATQIQMLYDSIGPLLIKLESLVLGTSTGLSDKMKIYYKFWEKQAFDCILRYVRILSLFFIFISFFAFNFSHIRSIYFIDIVGIVFSLLLYCGTFTFILIKCSQLCL